ncbi:Hypothetical predicted protein [Octopus vulgaris]|uniref:Uncharacterized protein n=1 Tax=Octopus vulgaris TaxID=6645 RepID=A0AA36FE80_OCTVU|nr:Hypothetical predicted protein [Octopus vulgaris]
MKEEEERKKKKQKYESGGSGGGGGRSGGAGDSSVGGEMAMVEAVLGHKDMEIVPKREEGCDYKLSGLKL